MKISDRLLIEIPTPSCHASTLCKTALGYAVAWFGGTAEKNNDVGIYVTLTDGKTYSEPVRVSKEDGIPHWNPVLWRHENGNLLLYYKVGFDTSEWVTYLAVSEDDGANWSVPRPLVPGDTSGGRGPVKNKPLRLTDGTVLAPASSEQGQWKPFIDVSRDGGFSFERTDFIEAPIVDGKPIGMIQPTLWESPAGCVHAFLRTDAGKIARTDSADFGKTWSRAYLTDLANNNSGIDLTMAQNGTLVLACNPVSGNWKARTPLVLMTSTDGEQWNTVLTLEDTPGEYSYPAVVAEGNKISLTYTWNREKVAFRCIEL